MADALMIRRPSPGRRRRGERGASLVEYGLLLALIFVVCVGAVQAFGTTTAGAMSSYSTGF